MGDKRLTIELDNEQLKEIAIQAIKSDLSRKKLIEESVKMVFENQDLIREVISRIKNGN